MEHQLHKILMVEDDPDIQVIARLSLEAVGGYTVEMCDGGVEALQKVESFAPDLVLLDVMMPDMDGPTVLQHLRASDATCHLPIVFMTAKAQTHEIASYRALGALDVVSKPFDPMTLSATIAHIWEARLWPENDAQNAAAPVEFEASLSTEPAARVGSALQ